MLILNLEYLIVKVLNFFHTENPYGYEQIGFFAPFWAMNIYMRLFIKTNEKM
jgi:hypothetical protein